MSVSRVLRGAGVLALVLVGCPTPVPTLPDAVGTTVMTAGPAMTDGSVDSTSTNTSTSTSTGSESTSGSESSTGPSLPPPCEAPDVECGPQCDPWWDPSWSYRQRVSVALPLDEFVEWGTLEDVVVPIRLDDAFPLGCAQWATGDDLRFVREVDVGVFEVMPAELDEWGSSGSTAWVRVPQLLDGSASFWVYYGNAEAEAEAGRASDVWAAESTGYQAVLHLGDDFEDSSPGQHHGTAPKTDDPPNLMHVEGVVGHSIHFEPVQEGQRVELSGTPMIDAAIEQSDELTVTAWVQVTPQVVGTTTWKSIVGRGSDHWGLTVWDEACMFSPGTAIPRFLTECDDCEQGCSQQAADMCPQCPCPGMGACDGFETIDIPSAHPDFPDCEELESCPALHTGNHWVNGTTSLVTDDVVSRWFFVAAVYGPAGVTCDRGTDCECDPEIMCNLAVLPAQVYEKRIYVDGRSDAAPKCGCFPYTVNPDANAIAIGTSAGMPNQFAFHGEIDEIRISSRAWSSPRIRAEYELTRRDRSPVTLGAVESCGARCP